MKFFLRFSFIFLFGSISLFSYGFLDPGIVSFVPMALFRIVQPLYWMTYNQRGITASIVSIGFALAFVLYALILKRRAQLFPSMRSFLWFILPVAFLGIVSYPMVSYDLFNYVTTAKVAYHYQENPYITMPIEIPNEPFLQFTRAANKVALYGPTWIGLSFIPHVLGRGNIWETMFWFKLLNGGFYMLFLVLIWKMTKSMERVVWFGLNPLVLIETLIAGHNDIVMVALAGIAFYLVDQKQVREKLFGLMLFVLSILVKGSVLVLTPLLFLTNVSKDKRFFIASLLLLLVFVIAGPLREELYPWYAVWFLGFASFIPKKQYEWFFQFATVFSIGLEFRHIPYIGMGYYEGPGPMLRMVITLLPVVLWLGWILWEQKHQKQPLNFRLHQKNK